MIEASENQDLVVIDGSEGIDVDDVEEEYEGEDKEAKLDDKYFTATDTPSP